MSRTLGEELTSDAAHQVARVEVAELRAHLRLILETEEGDAKVALVAARTCELALELRDEEVFVRYPELGVDGVEAARIFPLAELVDGDGGVVGDDVGDSGRGLVGFGDDEHANADVLAIECDRREDDGVVTCLGTQYVGCGQDAGLR